MPDIILPKQPRAARRQQFPLRGHVELPDERLEELKQLVLTDEKHDRADSAALYQDREVAFEQYVGLREPIDYPWPNASNLHIPLTMWVIDGMHAFMMNTIWSPDEIVQARPTERGDVELARKKGQYMNWHVTVENPDLYNQWEAASHDAAQYGTGILEVDYLREVERVRDTATIPRVPGTPAEELAQQFFTSTFEREDQTIERITRGKGTTWNVLLRRTARSGEQVPARARVQFFFDDPDQVVVDVEYELTTKDHPRATRVDLEDFIAPAHGTSLQELDHFIRVYRLTTDDLFRARERGFFRFDDEVAEKLVGLTRGADVRGSETSNLPGSRREHAGASRHNRSGRRTDIEVLGWFGHWDVDGDGYREKIIVYIVRETRDVIGVRWLHELYRHGKWPFVRVIRKQNDEMPFWGMGVARQIEALQDEINQIHNINVNRWTLEVLPVGVYVPAPGFRPDIRMIRPGEFIPTAGGTNSAKWLEMSSRTGPGIEQEQLLLGFASRLLPADDIVLGKLPAQQGATRTATGVAGILSRAGIRLDQELRYYQRAFSELLDMLWDTQAQYGPPQKYFRVLGERGIQEQVLTKSDFLSKPDFVLMGNSSNTNPAARLERLTMAASILNDPFDLQIGLQLFGMPLIARRIKFKQQFLKELGFKDAADFLPPIPDDFMEEPLVGDQLISQLLQGSFIEPSPLAVERQLRDVTQFINSDEFGKVPAEILSVFARFMQRAAEVRQQVQLTMLQAMAQGAQGGVQAPQTPGEGNMLPFRPPGTPGAASAVARPTTGVSPALLENPQAGSARNV